MSETPGPSGGIAIEVDRDPYLPPSAVASARAYNEADKANQQRERELKKNLDIDLDLDADIEDQDVVGGWVVVVVGLLTMMAAGYGIWYLWEAFHEAARSTTGSTVTIRSLGLLGEAEVGVSTVLNLMLVFLGVMGATAASLRSAANHMGRGDFSADWLPWYFISPVVGGFTALVVWWAIVAGLLGFTAGTDTVNAYGLASLAIFAGLFSKKALAKLSDIFDTVFHRDDRSARFVALREDLDKVAQMRSEDRVDDEEYSLLKARVIQRFSE